MTTAELEDYRARGFVELAPAEVERIVAFGARWSMPLTNVVVTLARIGLRTVEAAGNTENTNTMAPVAALEE